MSDQLRIEVVLHPNPKLAARFRKLLSGSPAVDFSSPCSHSDLVAKMRDCDLLLTDSGGMQEEAPALGTPALVLRERTERPEALESGNARLVGLETADIIDAVQDLIANPARLAAMSRRALPFGDGSAGRRIAAVIGDWLDENMGSHLRTA